MCLQGLRGLQNGADPVAKSSTLVGMRKHSCWGQSSLEYEVSVFLFQFFMVLVHVDLDVA